MNHLDRFRAFGGRDYHWRGVDRKTTMDIAHRCTTGVTFQGSSKSAIIDGIAKPCGYSSNPAKFAYMMDGAAMEIPKFKKEYDRKVYVELIRLADQYKADSKP